MRVRHIDQDEFNIAVVVFDCDECLLVEYFKAREAEDLELAHHLGRALRRLGRGVGADGEHDRENELKWGELVVLHTLCIPQKQAQNKIMIVADVWGTAD